MEEEFLQSSLQKKIDDDIAERTKVHQANIRRLQAAKAVTTELDLKVGNRPLVMLAQGDSWFDYPLTGNGLPLTDTDVIAQLRHVGSNSYTILNLAHRGDAATQEMSLPKQERMITALRDKSNWLHGKPDAILISAGGNDIAGDQFCIFLDFNDGKSKGLNADRFNQMLGVVEACYQVLFSLRDRYAAGVPIFGHCYDFPIPNGKHPICAGPWLKPSLDFCNWSTPQGTAIVHDALAAFRNMMLKLASNAANNFHIVDTQGTISAGDWANELHPEPDGFKKIALKFADALEKNVQVSA